MVQRQHSASWGNDWLKFKRKKGGAQNSKRGSNRERKWKTKVNKENCLHRVRGISLTLWHYPPDIDDCMDDCYGWILEWINKLIYRWMKNSSLRNEYINDVWLKTRELISEQRNEWITNEWIHKWMYEMNECMDGWISMHSRNKWFAVWKVGQSRTQNVLLRWYG